MDFINPSNKCQLDQITLKYCNENLNENVNTRTDVIANFREWILNETGLKSRVDDFHLLRFLRSCKFDDEKAKKKLLCYYKLRTETPEWFCNRLPKDRYLDILKLGIFLPIPQHDNEERIIIIIRPAAYDPKQYHLNDLLKIGLIILDWLLATDQKTSVYGVIPIIDLQGFSFGHVRQLSITIIRKLVYSWQDCYPVRICSMEFVNTPSYVDTILNIFRSFMTKKLKDRVHVHGMNLETLYEFVSNRILPKEYGGLNGNLQDLKNYWGVVLKNIRNWIDEEETYKFIDE